MMRIPISLTAIWWAFQAKFGAAQTTCWSGSANTLSNTCVYEITCVPVGAVASGFAFPPASVPSNNCAGPSYTCSTSTDILSIVIEETFFAIVCTYALNSAATTTSVASVSKVPATSTVILPTAPILSLSITAVNSPQTTSVFDVSSSSSASKAADSLDATVSSGVIISSRTSSLPSTTAAPSGKTTTSYPPLPIYSGGDLLRNYCITPEFTLLPGPKSTIVIYAAFIGCVNDKPDCCPFVVSSTTSTTIPTNSIINNATSTLPFSLTTSMYSDSLAGLTSTIQGNPTPLISTVSVVVTSLPTPSQATTTSQLLISTRQIFPTAAMQTQATLSKCPQDYHMVSSSCCPAGYVLYTTAIAGFTPCYSPLSSLLNVTPPPGLTLDPSTLPISTASSETNTSELTTLSTATPTPSMTTSIGNDVYYAVPFAVNPPSGAKVTPGDIVAISLLSLLGLSALSFWFFWRRLLERRKAGLEAKYTVVWIAPLEIEALAATKILDHLHDHVKFTSGRNEEYLYTAGDINGHNIIIATFPAGHSYGVGAAASLARAVKAKFPNLWFGLLVGVAAGLPDLSKTPPRDIRLGDVLVGLGQNGSPTIVSYGFGKETAQEFQLGGVEGKTAKLVGAAIRAMTLSGSDQWPSFRRYYDSLRGIRHNDNDTPIFADPGQDNDHLFANRGRDNEGNRLSEEVPRQPRPVDERTKVWYGKIGSGDRLMKNAEKRDELIAQVAPHDILGLEMEAAGVMDVIPVGVIRGVCDYADEHKNKEWQPYAAATAASYAKALLYKINPEPELNGIEAAVSSLPGAVGKKSPTVTTTELQVPPTRSPDQDRILPT